MRLFECEVSNGSSYSLTYRFYGYIVSYIVIGQDHLQADVGIGCFHLHLYQAPLLTVLTLLAGFSFCRLYWSMEETTVVHIILCYYKGQKQDINKIFFSKNGGKIE